MELIVKAKYPKIYVTQAKSYENYRQVVRPQFGHRITTVNRQFAIDSFANAFEENPSIVRDYDTLCEMESFQLVEHVDKEGKVTRSKQEAAGSAHDDLVMAFAAFFLVRQQQTALINKPTTYGAGIGQSFAEIEAAYLANKEKATKAIEKDYASSAIGAGNYGGCF